MKSKHLLHVSVAVPEDLEESVGAILESIFDTSAVFYHDLETSRNLVSVYVPAARMDRTAKRAELARQLTRLDEVKAKAARPKIAFRQLKPTDWAESWKRHFKPIEIPGKLLIKPSWSRRKPKGAEQLVVLDPGLSFGTGQHPTTRFCLEQLAAARLDQVPQAFLDIGTGTGILAIAAAKLGYEPVQAFDYDPESVRIADENARLNQVRNIQLSRQDLTQLPLRGAAKSDAICANLTHDLLIHERKRIISRLKRGGFLILAGILNSQFNDVEAAYLKAGMVRSATRTENEWTSGVFRFDGDGNGA